MNQGKYAAPPKRRRRRRNTLKPLLVAMAVVLLIGCAAGGTLAWLTDTTDEVVNTFTVGDISIDLTETWNHDSNNDGVNDSWQGKMIPGCTIAKDPKVTVKAGSEKCYLFVKVTESDNLGSYISYQVDTDVNTGWKKLDGYNNVYYRVVESSNVDQPFVVLKDNQVTVLNTVTKGMMNDLSKDSAVQPTLTFQAAAVQFYKSNDVEFGAADAYAQVSSSLT